MLSLRHGTQNANPPSHAEATVTTAILFDAAGTLFRVRGSAGAAYASVASRYGVIADADATELRFRQAFRQMPPLAFGGVAETQLQRYEYEWWKRVVQTTFGTTVFDDFDAVFQELFAHFARPDAWELFPETLSTLTALRQRPLRLGIVSNFDARLLPICAGLGILGCFDTVVISSRAGFAKPDPRIFAAALRHLGVAPHEAIHVGDSESEDLAGAQAAGMRGLLLRREGSVERSAAQISNLRELLTLV